MKKQKFQDERVLTQRNRISNEVITILLILLAGSVFVQHLFFGAPFEQFAVEAIISVGIGAYMVIRRLMLGVTVWDESHKTKLFPFIGGLIGGVIVTAITGVANYIQHSGLYAETGYGLFGAILAITFVSSFAVTFFILLCISFMNNKIQTQIEKRLEAEENDCGVAFNKKI